ncbi:MAG: SDR family NAD(P)-dependent oxidoreductase [Verrucomicrobiota bacterium]
MLEMFDLTGKNAVVVGGAGDLGVAMLEALVEAGSRAVVIDLSESVHDVAKSLSAKGFSVHPIQADISCRDQIRSSYAEALEFLGGRVDILLNSAGIQRRHPSEVFPEKDWDDVLAVNLSAIFFYCQLAAKTMIPQGRGKIINVASMQSFFGGITIPAYAASKGGVAQLTKALSNDWAAKGINVNGIAPGYMDTRLNTALINDPVRNAEALSRIPQKRWGTGKDMKGLAVFLASAASDYISGAIIPADGGYLGR